MDYSFEFTGSDLKKIADELSKEVNGVKGTEFGDYSTSTYDPIPIAKGCKKDSSGKPKGNCLYAYKSSFIRNYLKDNLKKRPESDALKCNNLDSRGGNATGCSDSTTDITATEALAQFKARTEEAERQ